MFIRLHLFFFLFAKFLHPHINLRLLTVSFRVSPPPLLLLLLRLRALIAPHTATLPLLRVFPLSSACLPHEVKSSVRLCPHSAGHGCKSPQVRISRRFLVTLQLLASSSSLLLHHLEIQRVQTEEEKMGCCSARCTLILLCCLQLVRCCPLSTLTHLLTHQACRCWHINTNFYLWKSTKLRFEATFFFIVQTPKNMLFEVSALKSAHFTFYKRVKSYIQTQ